MTKPPDPSVSITTWEDVERESKKQIDAFCEHMGVSDLEEFDAKVMEEAKRMCGFD